MLVLGGGLVGVELAEKLGLEGKDVLVVEMLPELAAGMEAVSKALTLERLGRLAKVTLLTSTTVRRVGRDALVLDAPAGEQSLPPVDVVLLAAGIRPLPLPREVSTLVEECRVVGDAEQPADVCRATEAGYRAALEV